MKFLYAQKENKINETVLSILRYHGHTVDIACDGNAALAFSLAEKYDALILDEALARKSGIEVMEALRLRGKQTPILIISEESVSWKKCTSVTRYIEKPFAIGEFLAHIRTLCSSREDIFPSDLRFGDIVLNIHSSTISGNDRSITLPKMESRLMELLIFSNGSYISTENILSRVWGENTPTEIGIVWVYISYLRRKLASLSEKVKIKGKRNIGYTLCIEE